MAKVMNLQNLRNHVSRNGFDLSENNAFTAKCGELLPIITKEVLPGDHFEIDLRTFTRTQPLQTAAFTNFRQYYDFFFVPYSQIWHNWNAFITNLGSDASQKATSILRNAQIGTIHPHFSKVEMLNVLRFLKYTPNDDVKNIFGFNRGDCACKLLQLLGYGNYLNQNLVEAPYLHASWASEDVALNAFPLLAYQKIYQDFYRNSQWEKPNPSTYNLDYINGATVAETSLKLEAYVGTELESTPTSQTELAQDTFFDLRYSNWEKDYFMGLVPNSQVGDVAIAAPLTGTIAGGFDYLTPLEPGTDISINLGDNSINPNTAGLSALALRQAEFLQRWKEIAQSGSKDYKDQVYKHWGVELSEETSKLVKFLGGTSSVININEVLNTNLTADNKANIQGKGVGVGDGHISFDAKEHGLIMCIYHCVPLLQYDLNTETRLCTKVNVTDYAIPEFDKLGMQPVLANEIINPMLDDATETYSPFLLGYAPRYFEYKTSFDKINGAFSGTLADWSINLDGSYFQDFFLNYANKINYTFFKCNPKICDKVFGVNADSSVNTDTFLVNSSFDVKVARNLDYNGMPY